MIISAMGWPLRSQILSFGSRVEFILLQCQGAALRIPRIKMLVMKIFSE